MSLNVIPHTHTTPHVSCPSRQTGHPRQVPTQQSLSSKTVVPYGLDSPRLSPSHSVHLTEPLFQPDKVRLLGLIRVLDSVLCRTTHVPYCSSAHTDLMAPGPSHSYHTTLRPSVCPSVVRGLPDALPGPSHPEVTPDVPRCPTQMCPSPHPFEDKDFLIRPPKYT